MAQQQKPLPKIVVPKNADEKKKALDRVITEVEKKFGVGTIIRMDGSQKISVDIISTGCLAIDIATGIGGIPKSRIVEIYGAESSGKTTVTLQCIAEAQKCGGAAAFIDAEHALDPIYAQKLGVDLLSLYVSQPDSGEQALDILDELVKSAAFDIVVIDSVAALTPRAEIEGEMGANAVGLQARLMSKALRKLTAHINESNTCVVFINQVRDKIGISYGNPEVTTGGKALKFFSSIRMEIRKGKQILDGGDVVGYRTKCKVTKNKLAPPFKVAEFDMIFGEGASKIASIIDFAESCDIIKKSGSWFSYNNDKIGQGKENVKKFLKEKPELLAEIETKVKDYVANNTNIPGLTTAGDDDVDDAED